MNFLQRLRSRETVVRHTLLRRWYIVAAVVLCMLPVLYSSTVSTGVYYSRAQVMFLPPPSKVGGNALKSEAVTTVMYAAIVERRFNGNDGQQKLRTTDAPLYATGLRNGYSVFLPNSGGQWQMSFDDPEIVVEVVSENQANAISEMTRITEKLRDIASEQQETIGVQPEALIATELSPAQPVAMYVGVRKSRELAALLVLAAAAAIGLPLFADRIIRGFSRLRDHRRSRDGEAGPVRGAGEMDAGEGVPAGAVRAAVAPTPTGTGEQP